MVDLVERWNNLTNWNQGGEGLIEISPAGQLHLIPDISKACWVWRNDIEAESKVKIRFRLKIDHWGGVQVALNYGMVDGKELQFQIQADKIRYARPDGEFDEFSIATDNNWHVWYLKIDFALGTLTVYRDNIWLVDFSDDFAAGEENQITIIADSSPSDQMEIHLDYIYYINGLEDFPSVVDNNIGNDSPVLYPFQHKAFYANSLYWVFFADPLGFYYRTSSNGVSWNARETVRTGSGLDGTRLSVYFDGNYVHIVYVVNNDMALYYRRGIPESTGTITWSQNEQLVESEDLGLFSPTITCDTNGYPWIGIFMATTEEPIGIPRVYKSMYNDGRFGCESPFPFTLKSTETDNWIVLPVALNDGKVIIIYAAPSLQTFYGRRWTGSAMGDERSAPSGTCTTMSYSAAGLATQARFVWLSTEGSNPDTIQENIFDYNSDSWGNASPIETNTNYLSYNMGICLSKDEDIIYYFWISSKEVYFRRRINGILDQYPILWFTIPETMSHEYQISIYDRSYEKFIGVTFGVEPQVPFIIKFNKLLLPSIVDLTIDSEEGIGHEVQRTSYFAYGRYWEFFLVSQELRFRTSQDGITWTSSTPIGPEFLEFSIWFDGTHVHYVKITDTGLQLRYCKGLPDLGGTITWLTGENVVAEEEAPDYWVNPSITVDSGGYPWIGVTRYRSGVGIDGLVYKSSRNDGVWQTDFAETVITGGDWYQVVPTALGNGKVIIFYWSGTAYHARRWTGSLPLGSERSEVADILFLERNSCIGLNNEARFCYLNTPERDVIENVFNYDSDNWIGEEVIDDAESERDNVILCWDSANNTIYYFWFKWADHSPPPPRSLIYSYKKRINGTLEAEATPWFIDCALGEGGSPTHVYTKPFSSKIGLSYLTIGGSFLLKFKNLETPLGPIELDLYESFSFPLEKVSSKVSKIFPEFSLLQDTLSKKFEKEPILENLKGESSLVFWLIRSAFLETFILSPSILLKYQIKFLESVILASWQTTVTSARFYEFLRIVPSWTRVHYKVLARWILYLKLKRRTAIREVKE